MLRIGIVAGEASGDFLGADLINALRGAGIEPAIEGIGGEKLIAAGCHSLYPMERLSVMGIGEVLGRYRELHAMRRSLIDHFIAKPPDVFIGVDAPDFNFTLEKKLRGKGIKVIHYVSPSIWAWREYRLRGIAKAVDRMLTLFPFEAPYYEKYGIPVSYVGHPLAADIPLQTDRLAARERLGMPASGKVLAVLPGSRQAELRQHTVPFLQAAMYCQERVEELRLVSNLVNDTSLETFRAIRAANRVEVDVAEFSGRCHDVLAAADVVLLASGTVALEAMLIKRPMVVGYRVNWLTYQIAKRMIMTTSVSLPNLLAGRQIVPECLQSNCQVDVIGSALMRWFTEPQSVAQLTGEFDRLHRELMPLPESDLAAVVMNVVDANV